MSRPVSRISIVGSIVRKDIAEYGRDKLWAFLTIMVLVVVIGLYWVLPDDVDESLRIAVSGLEGAAAVSLESEGQGLVLVSIATEADLEAVVAGEADVWEADGAFVVIRPDSGIDAPEGAEKIAVDIGVAFPDGFFVAAAAGEQVAATVYVESAVPAEVRATVSGLIRERVLAAAGVDLPVETPDPNVAYVVLGEDRVGDQATAQDSFRPLLVFLVLLMELFVMASLIAKEIQDRTVTAMLVTPATIGDVLAAKGIAGTASGFGQAVIILVAIGAVGVHPVLILTLMLLGAVMVSGAAMIAGSSGKDFMSTLFYGMVFMIPLMIPAFAALFPGTASFWVQLLPSYPLVDGLVEVSTYGAGWADIAPQLLALLAWCVALFAAGWLVLKRKVQTL